jgi:acetyl-CoA carboxylase carboxyl transferase subunit beta
MEFELEEEEKRKWWQRKSKGLQTSTNEKLETPDGIWHQCKKCKTAVLAKEHKEHLSVCSKCGYHDRIGSAEYFSIFFDNEQYEVLFENILPTDRLNFVDEKPYTDRIKAAQKSTGLTEALRVGKGDIHGIKLVIACMDFSFIGGSMGSVVGERISKGIDEAIKEKAAFMIISKSGGARMMESTFSLMQMAKTSAKLTRLGAAGLPYISLMTDPTTGGVSASYAMLGDVNISEPNALIGFAGPRVVKETIKKDLPKGFQSAESVLENGFLDLIVERKKLKTTVAELLATMMKKQLNK